MLLYEILNGIAPCGKNDSMRKSNQIEIIADITDSSYPPHFEAAGVFKDRLEELELKYSSEGEGDFDALIDQVTGKDITRIMKISQQLKVLTIDGFKVHISNCSKEYTNECIKTLNLLDCCFDVDALSLISSNLMGLKNLTFEGRISDMDDNWKCHNYEIDMPHTSFDNICWTDSNRYNFSHGYIKIYLKEGSNIGVDYYMLDGEGWMTESSETEFVDKCATVRAGYHQTMDIRCEDLKTITTKFTYTNGNRKTTTKKCGYSIIYSADRRELLIK